MSSLLTSTDSRYVMFPILDDDIWQMYKKQVNSFWRAEEIDLTTDLSDWKKLTDNEQYFIKMILAFFAASDGIVLENLAARFMMDVQLAEARAFYGFQIAMENIHSETYSLLIDTYIDNEKDKHKLFTALDNFPCIAKKAEWAKKWIHDINSSFETRIIAFACVEGIFFSGAFCSIYWLKKRGILHGLTFSNELIARDEALHTEFAILLHNKLQMETNKTSIIAKEHEKQIHEIIKEATEIEMEFIGEALPCNLIGMNATMMSQYIKFIADRLALQLNAAKIYNATNPFEFMDFISLETKTNFFERKVSSYALANKTNDGSIFDENAYF